MATPLRGTYLPTYLHSCSRQCTADQIRPAVHCVFSCWLSSSSPQKIPCPMAVRGRKEGAALSRKHETRHQWARMTVAVDRKGERLNYGFILATYSRPPRMACIASPFLSAGRSDGEGKREKRTAGRPNNNRSVSS